MRRGLVAACALAGTRSVALPASAFSCATMDLEGVTGDPSILSIVETRRVTSLPGLVPVLSAGHDVLEPVSGWGGLNDRWRGPIAPGAFIYPDCLDMSEATLVLIVERQFDTILVDGSALTDEFRSGLDDRFGRRVESSGDGSIVPAVLSAAWPFPLIAGLMAGVVIRSRRRRRRDQRA